MTKSRAEKLKTRPDLDEEAWLTLVEELSENRELQVRAIYRRMLNWCREKRQTPTRRRLLKWLDNEREAVPIKNLDPDCDECGNERRIRGNVDSWPCDACRPEQYAAWLKQRGK